MGLIASNSDNPDAKKLFANITTFFRTSADLELKPTLWKYISTPKFKKVMKSLDNINEITVKYITEVLKRLEEERKFSKNKPDSEKSILEKLLKVDKKIATVMAMDMLMAGVDTVSKFYK